VTQLDARDDATADPRKVTGHHLRQASRDPAVAELPAAASELFAVATRRLRREVRASDTSHAHHMVVVETSLALTSTGQAVVTARAVSGTHSGRQGRAFARRVADDVIEAWGTPMG
jgi:hypothetical protein